MLGEIVAASAIGVKEAGTPHHASGNGTAANITELFSEANTAAGAEPVIHASSIIAAAAVTFVAAACYLLYFDAEPTGELRRARGAQ